MGQQSTHDSHHSAMSSTLLAGARRKEARSWSQLERLYSPLVDRWCRQANLQPQDAADVRQEVLTAVFSSLDKFRRERPTDRFSSWMYGIFRNKLMDHWRKRGQEPNAMGGTVYRQTLEQTPDNLDEGESAIQSPGEESDLVRRAIDLLQPEFKEHTWKAFLKTTVDERPAAEVAEELGMSAGAVYVAKHRVLRRLKTLLEDLGDFDDLSR